MASDALDPASVIDTAATLEAGDQVNLTTADYDYANALDVKSVDVTTWSGVESDWRTARVELASRQSTVPIEAVDDGRVVRQHPSRTFQVLEFAVDGDGDGEDTSESEEDDVDEEIVEQPTVTADPGDWIREIVGPIRGLGEATVDRLESEGYERARDLEGVEHEELVAIPYVGLETAHLLLECIQVETESAAEESVQDDEDSASDERPPGWTPDTPVQGDVVKSREGQDVRTGSEKTPIRWTDYSSNGGGRA